jgi:hypothetical protein
VDGEQPAAPAPPDRGETADVVEVEGEPASLSSQEQASAS